MEPHTGGDWDRANVQCGPGGHARNAGDRAHQPTDQGAIRRGDEFLDVTDPYLYIDDGMMLNFSFSFFSPFFIALAGTYLRWVCSGHTCTLTYISTFVD